MRIAICDDDQQEVDRLIQVLQGWDRAQNVELFCEGSVLLAKAKVSPPFDIVFLEIYMPCENGICIAKTLREISPETGIVFITTSKEHAVDAFSLRALHYLIKPVTAEDVREVFYRLTTVRANRREVISFTVGRDKYTVFLDQIIFLESVNHAVEVSMSDGQQLKVWEPLSELERKLDGSFLKINRGTVVNMGHIRQMGTDSCVLMDGSRLFIATRKRTAARAAYDDYLFSRRKIFSQRKRFEKKNVESQFPFRH